MKSLIILTLFAGLVAPVPGPSAARAATATLQEPAPAAAPTGPQVDLNSATTSQLEALPGIGPATAKRIVEYREQHGPFKKVEDLMNVRGIGEKSFLKLKPQITVGKSADARSAATE